MLLRAATGLLCAISFLSLSLASTVLAEERVKQSEANRDDSDRKIDPEGLIGDC